MLLKKENVILREEDKGKINELKLAGYEEIKEEDLKKEAEKANKSVEKAKKEEEDKKQGDQ